MGVRPSINVIFGIDDFNGEHLDYEELERPVELPPHGKGYPFENSFLWDVFSNHETGEPLVIPEKLYYGGWKEGNEGIIGLTINRSAYDSDFVRALAVFYPEFEMRGKLDFPAWTKEDHPLYARRLLVRHHDGTDTLPDCGDIVFQWSWFYPSIIEQHSMWPVHAFCTRWLFQQAGLDIDYHRYKAMLVWDWC